MIENAERDQNATPTLLGVSDDGLKEPRLLKVLPDGSLKVGQLVGFTLPAYDYIDMSYDANENMTQVVYKTGGSSGTIVATLTLGYDVNNNLTSVEKS